ncbi:MAG: cupin domain-containing protein [Burkholderiaceae bacterium]
MTLPLQAGDLDAGITPAHQGLDGISWHILGQIYVPKHLSADSFSWHATFPIETFVPPHLHTTQDEYIYLLDGRIDLLLDKKQVSAQAGDLVRMPRGIPHGFYNNSGKPVTCLFWVSPTGKLFELYKRIHGMATPAEVMPVAREHEVIFLPPVSAARPA